MRLIAACSLALVFMLSCGRTELLNGRAHGGRGGGGGHGARGGGGGADQAGAPAEAGASGAAMLSCDFDADCADPEDLCRARACQDGECVDAPPLSCDDGDACTKDGCDPTTGQCLHEASPDEDGDTHFAIPEGVPAGMCGDDCDDHDDQTYPGAPELCDGKDNNCDGSVDEHMDFTYQGFQPVRVSGDEFERAARAGLAVSDAGFAVTYTGLSNGHWRSFLQGITADGASSFEPVPVSEINADTYAGLLVSSEGMLASAWADARKDGNYEIYFNRFTPQGEKLGPDLRLSEASDFSLHPMLVTHSGLVMITWDDRRLEDGGGPPAQIYSRHVDADGNIGLEMLLTPDEQEAEYPWVAAGNSGLGLAYTVFDGVQSLLHFRTFALDGTSDSAVLDVGAFDVQEPSVVSVNGGYVVAWQTYNLGPGPAIYAAVVSAHGELLHPPQAVTEGANFARSFSLISLGDSVLLIWADDHDGNYDLYSELLDLNLAVTRPRERITFNGADTLWPIAALSPGGGIGILFDDWETGPRQVYFTRLDCIVP